MKEHYQIVVIGGGINGVGVAREAAARGYSTLLIEKTDFAHATSSQSSKLIHGGIRYLEQGKFKLVRESLRERYTLVKMAPHLVHPLPIYIPVYENDLRGVFKMRMGCLLYDWFAGSKKLMKSYRLKKRDVKSIPGLNQEGLQGVIAYSDGQVLDSRLCLESALSAESYGASVHNYMELVEVVPAAPHYQLVLLDHRSGRKLQVTAQFIINAAGPWVSQLDALITRQPKRPKLQYVRGIHFVLPKITEKAGFLTLPEDGRVVFVLPWLKKYTLVGTTESLYEGDNFDKVPPSEDEKQYLLKVLHQYFPQCGITLDDVLYFYSGVRTLLAPDDEEDEDNLSQVSREYRIEKELLSKHSGYLAIYGGKLTTYRSLGEKVINQVASHLPKPKETPYSTKTTPLFGGFTVSPQKHRALMKQLKQANIASEVIEHWQAWYGSQWTWIADLALSSAEMQRVLVAPHFLKAELQYLVDVEKAYTLEDVMTRRTKLVYEISEEQQKQLEEELQAILKETRAN